MSDRRACQNDRDDSGGDWCPGWIVFQPGQPQGKCDSCGGWYGVLGNSDPTCPRQDGWDFSERLKMHDFRAALTEWQETIRIMRGPDVSLPSRIAMGTSAYVRLREIADHGADPGLPNAHGSASRSMLMLIGLPITVEEKWPPNLWAIVDSDGKAFDAGILNDLP